MNEEIINNALNGDVDAKNKLYLEYKYIVDIMVRKYNSVALSLGIDSKDLEQEAYYAFSDALNSYRLDKNAKLETFISLCINRRLQKVIKKNTSEKARLLNNMYSLDYDYNEEGTTLKDIISDDSKNDPLVNLANEEEYSELMDKIRKSLSDSEYEVFNYYINNFDYITIAELIGKSHKQVDNTIQRVKHKIRDIIKD